jgi:hypothetical protein
MDPTRLAGLVVTLGRAFRARGMRSHLTTLRLYFLALRHGLTSGGGHALRAEWSEEAVLDWLRILRVPPYERDYPVRARGSRCLRCPRDDGHPVETATLVTFEGGAKMGCRACGSAWLEYD